MRKKALILKNISYKTFLEIVDISKIDKNLKFDYYIKIKLGINLFIYKKYYKYPIKRIIKKIYKFNTELKENKTQEFLFTYIKIKPIEHNV